MAIRFPHLAFLFVLGFGMPVVAVAQETTSSALAACTAHPMPLCVLDLARSELDGLGQAERPPDSKMWSEDMARYPDEDIASEAWRIVWDTYGKVAANYALLGQGRAAAEVFDGIGKPVEISSRLQLYMPAIKDKLDQAWLSRTLQAAAAATFPFGKPDSSLDDSAWRDILAMAAAAGDTGLLQTQLLRFDQYARTGGFRALSGPERDDVYASMLGLVLLRGDIERARAVPALIASPERREYATMQIAEWLAQQGKSTEALDMAKGMSAVRHATVAGDAAAYLAQHGSVEQARELLTGLDDLHQSTVIEALITPQSWPQAKALSSLLDLGGRARVLVAIMRVQIGEGNLDTAAATAREIDEVGERAVAFGALSLAAARQQRKDLVSEAIGEVEKMGTYKVDLSQIADAETALLYALANLDGGLSAAQKSSDVRELLDRITPEAFPDDPMQALSAPEDRARLLMQLAGAQFALGFSAEAEKSVDAVVAMGGGEDPAEEAFIKSEAAGLAYGLTNAERGAPAVRQALGAISRLNYPMDRAMELAHLAETMSAQ